MKLVKLTKLCDLGRHMHDECYNPTESGFRWVATSGATPVPTCSYLVTYVFIFSKSQTFLHHAFSIAKIELNRFILKCETCEEVSFQEVLVPIGATFGTEHRSSFAIFSNLKVSKLIDSMPRRCVDHRRRSRLRSGFHLGIGEAEISRRFSM